MKKLFTSFLILFFWTLSSNLYSQTSPDYIFGNNDVGSGWSWTSGTQGTSSLGGSYKWQFQATAAGNQYFKFGETSSPDDGQGFWYVGSGPDVQYPGSGSFGDKWTAIYHANMGNAGAFYFSVTSGNYYVIKAKKQSGNDADFAVFWNDAAPVTITSVTRTISGTTLLVDVTLSGTKSAQEKVWVRYSTNNWASSNTVEADNNVSGNTWRATINLNSGDFVSYYAFTTLNLTSAPAESDADFYTINYNNNNGVNYTVQIGPLSGDYYIPQGSYSRGYDKLSTAVKNLNENGVGGNVTFYITGDITESENIFLGVNMGSYTLTIKPDADVDRTITFTKTTDNASSSGGFIIGLSSDNWTSRIKTDNIIIDGYATGGSTRRLRFISAPTSHTNTAPIVIIGNCENIQIKNTYVNYACTGTMTGNFAAIWIRTRVDGGSFAPNNIVVDNCEIIADNGGNTRQGVIVTYSGSTAPTEYADNIIIRNCKITARHRGIFLNYAANVDIYNNEFYINQPATGYASSGILAFVIKPGSTVKIYNNKINELKTANATTTSPLSYGIVGIRIETVGNYEIYNNWITGFNLTATSPRGHYHGISIATGTTAGITAKVYYNTVVVNDVTNPGGTAHTDYRISAFYLNYSGTSGTRVADVRNNIFISNEIGAESQCFYWANTGLATLTTDYNLFYYSDATNGYTGRTGATNRKTLTDWQTALQSMTNVTGKDANSVSKNVTFVSSTDLHLSASHAGDYDLRATPIASITTDIDGDPRDNTYPYKGADELDVPAPVQLASFTANYSFNAVKLIWQTASEVNNYGWEIERSKVDDKTNRPSVWEKIGFVKGSGNSNSPREYTFVDDKVLYGYYVYRLKQIDNDGSYSYSNELRIMVGNKPQVYDVKNYPNPFNPQTVIRFDIPKASNVKLQVFDITGQLVATLVDEYMEAGVYERIFDGSRLPSGIYISVLQSEGVKVVRKMQLIK